MTRTNRRKSTVRSEPQRPAGFTLTELLVVVGIIALLAGILIPSLSRAITQVQRKAVCGNNLRTIVKGASTYAMADKRKRLPTVFDLPDKPGYDIWGDMTQGNPAALWLLVKSGQVPRRTFLCPEARQERGFEDPPADANRFSYDEDTEISTLSYSYISTTRNADWDEQLAEELTYHSTPSTLTIVADANPRTTFGKTSLVSYEDLNTAAGGKLGEDEVRNSLNHRRQGQNFARWDGGVRWSSDPNDFNDDDFYTSEVEQESDEQEGRREEKLDAFLIP